MLSTSQSIKRLPTVREAPPVTIEIPSIGVNAGIKGLAAEYRDGDPYLHPPLATLDDFTTAYWWNEKSAPANPSKGTVYIFGHTCRSDECPGVFDHLQEVLLGAEVRVTTGNGVFTYQVYKRHPYKKPRTKQVKSVAKKVPNRLVLVTCKLRSDGTPQTHNFVAWATLVSVEPS